MCDLPLFQVPVLQNWNFGNNIDTWRPQVNCQKHDFAQEKAPRPKSGARE